MKKEKDVGLFAIKSSPGWLLHGPVSNDIVVNNVSLIQSSHVKWKMKLTYRKFAMILRFRFASNQRK